MANSTPRAKPMPKSGVYSAIADKTSLTKKQVSSVFDALFELVKQEIGKKGPGVFSMPGMLKIRVRQLPATKVREGINPRTGEKIMIKAKPARRAVKAQVLKNLKELVK